MKYIFLRLITAIVLLDAVKGVPDQSPYIPAGERRVCVINVIILGKQLAACHHIYLADYFRS